MGSFSYSTSQRLIDTTYLDNCLGPSHLEHLSTPLSPVREGEVNDLSILGELTGGEQSRATVRPGAKPLSPPILPGPVSSFFLPSWAQTLLEMSLRGWYMGSLNCLGGSIPGFVGVPILLLEDQG